MITHYFKTALRQIEKNKVQYILSVIGIAVGLLCFSLTSYYIRKNNSQYTVWPHADRMAKVFVKSTAHNRAEQYVPGKELQALFDTPVAGIEKITYIEGYGQANITVCKEDGKEEPFQCSFYEVTPDFIPIYSLQTIEGKVPTLQAGEVLISESAVKRIFGKEAPVGRTLYFSRADSDTSAIRYATISAVIQDLSDGTHEAMDLYFLQAAPIRPNQNYWMATTLLLAEGVSSAEVNQRLQKEIPLFGEKGDQYLIVRTLKEEMLQPEAITATLLIPLIGALVLIVAMINFLKFCIQSFYNRTRELSLRKSLGSGRAGLFWLLFSEVGLLFILAAFLSFVLTELAIPLFYQVVAERFEGASPQFLRIDSAVLFRQQAEYLGLLFLLCTLIIAGAVGRIQQINLIEGIRGGSSKKHGIRNAMLGVQLFISLLFLGGSIGLSYISSQMAEYRYNTLSPTECARIWTIEMWEPQLQGHQEEIVTRIQALAGVEDVMYERTNFTTRNYQTPQGNKIPGRVVEASSNYATFMNLPIQGRMPQGEAEILASRALIWQLEKDGQPTQSVVLNDKSYQITGIFEQLPFDFPIQKHQLGQADSYHQFTVISVPPQPHIRSCYIKCIAGQEETVKREVLQMIRSWLPPTLPFTIRTQEEKLAQRDPGSELIGMLFSALSAISLFITVLGIYSAITLDTFSRQKEVAIRKINGAGSRTIASLFGKLYVRLLLVAALPAFAIVYLFLYSLLQKNTVMTDWLHSPVIWLSSLLLMGGIVFVTVAYRIYLVSRVNPAEVIKTE